MLEHFHVGMFKAKGLVRATSHHHAIAISKVEEALCCTAKLLDHHKVRPLSQCQTVLKLSGHANLSVSKLTSIPVCESHKIPQASASAFF